MLLSPPRHPLLVDQAPRIAMRDDARSGVPRWL
ncbi:MAG: hypothetical protein N838_12765 [Thiohalocapsa sp. PB-PSB1]|nr:MAG: hypothetical protein N838_12765 [Thiohalocapsa sp. PB-PSB1]